MMQYNLKQATGRAIACRYGVKYNGIQSGFRRPDFYLATDPITKTTVGYRCAMELEDKLMHARMMKNTTLLDFVNN